jgi:hypothetical protein
LAQGIPARLTAAEGRKFGLTVGIAFVVLAALARWRGQPAAAVVLLAVGGVLMAGGLVSPTRLGPIQRGWMSLAHAISKVTTPIVMGAVYFVVLAPVGFVMRALGRNPMVREESDGSFWVTRTAKDGRGTMEHQF